MYEYLSIVLLMDIYTIFSFLLLQDCSKHPNSCLFMHIVKMELLGHLHR